MRIAELLAKKLGTTAKPKSSGVNQCAENIEDSELPPNAQLDYLTGKYYVNDSDVAAITCHGKVIQPTERLAKKRWPIDEFNVTLYLYLFCLKRGHITNWRDTLLLAEFFDPPRNFRGISTHRIPMFLDAWRLAEISQLTGIPKQVLSLYTMDILVEEGKNFP